MLDPHNTSPSPASEKLTSSVRPPPSFNYSLTPRTGLRKTTVPRFLFRAYRPNSGGGMPHTVNNPNVTVPHAYMMCRTVPRFYETPECDLQKMANAHYHQVHYPLSTFSSWAASLHLVLCYALVLGKDACVAVMDTQQLHDEVRVWHAPQLLDAPNHEYLAHGIVCGVGLTAVSVEDLRQHGLGDTDYLRKIRALADLFGELWFPVATALLCVRPQPWLQRDATKGRSCPTAKQLSRLLRVLDVTVKPSWLDSQLPWLQFGAVKTTPDAGTYDFPDVRQWIDLLHAISRRDMPESNKRKRDDVLTPAHEANAKRQAVESNKVGV
ncbi:hypothetical protein EJ07DRAFT_134354 [Lizonia empirigonia]|nr:hypothetical protein EJ07DRAFT_134354 [Lizonia empirigonia]